MPRSSSNTLDQSTLNMPRPRSQILLLNERFLMDKQLKSRKIICSQIVVGFWARGLSTCSQRSVGNLATMNLATNRTAPIVLRHHAARLNASRLAMPFRTCYLKPAFPRWSPSPGIRCMATTATPNSGPRLPLSRRSGLVISILVVLALSGYGLYVILSIFTSFKPVLDAARITLVYDL